MIMNVGSSKRAIAKLSLFFLFILGFSWFNFLSSLIVASSSNGSVDPLVNFTPSVCYCRDNNADPNEISCDCSRIEDSDDIYASADPADVNYIRAWSDEPGWLRVEDFSSPVSPSAMESIHSVNLCIEWYVTDTSGTTCTIGVYVENTWQTIDSTCQDTESVYCYDITNYITKPSDLDTLQMNITYVGDSIILADDLYVDLVYLEVNYTPETIPPKWSNQEQSTPKPGVGAEVKLSAHWEDNGGLDYAILSTNETGCGLVPCYNKTILKLSGNSTWSNFTWQNSSLPAGTIVAWRIYANDTAGNENVTDIMTFEIKPTYLLVNLISPSPSIYTEKNPYLVAQNSTFWLNVSVKCYSEGEGGNCGTIIGDPRYNSSGKEPNELINYTPSTPFWYEKDIYRTVEGTNYLSNGGFEEGSANGWIVESGLVTPYVTSNVAHDGRFSFGYNSTTSDTTDTPNDLYWRITKDLSAHPVVVTEDLYFSMWIGDYNQTYYGNCEGEDSYINVTLGFDDGTKAIIASTLGKWYAPDQVYCGGNPHCKWTKLISKISNYKPPGSKIINLTIELRKGQDSYARYYPSIFIDSIALFNGTIPIENSNNTKIKFTRSYPAGYQEITNLIDYASLHQGATIEASSSVPDSQNNYDRYLPIRAIDDLAFNESYSGGVAKYWKSNNEGIGAWVNISFPFSVTLSRIDLWDPPDNNNVSSGHIEFEDGTQVPFGSLPPDGSRPLTVTFTPRTTSWIRIVIDGVEGVAGLAEVDAYSYYPSNELYVHTYTFPEVNKTSYIKKGIDSYFEVWDAEERFLLFNKSFSNIMGGDIYAKKWNEACFYLEDGEDCKLGLKINATGAINSIWALDMNLTSSFSIPENDTLSSIVKIVKAIRNFNLTLLSDTSQTNNKALAKLLDKNYNLMYSFARFHFQPLEYLQNYSLEITQKITSHNLTVLIHQINVTQDLNLIAQIVENYSNYLPSSITQISSLIAFNDTNLNYSHATLYLPKEGVNYNRILHCIDWNFTSANCSNWEINEFLYYSAQENSTHVWFNVSQFDAYALGALNSNLEIWDDTDTETKYVGDQVKFYANYTNTTSGEPIYGSGVTCNITFNISGSWTPWKQMTYNSTSKLYEYNRSFSDVGTFNWNVSCDGSALGYEPLNASDTFTISSPSYLEVYLDFPTPGQTTYVVQNSTFWINATVICRGGDCGSVNGTVRYNASSQEPDTPIPTTYGSAPFFINETPAYSTKQCGNLLEDQTCKLSWLINATGSINSAWKIDVNFSSDTGISNDTENAIVQILDCLVDITIHFTDLQFGELVPSTKQNPAVGNSQNLYNISVNKDSCTTNLYIKGEDLINATYNSIIGIGNLTFNNVTNDYSSSYRLSDSYQVLKLNVPENTNVTLWFWIDVPPVYAGYYKGTIYINGERSA